MLSALLDFLHGLHVLRLFQSSCSKHPHVTASLLHRPLFGHLLARKQDDDESYDSFEDDDDSYDSYDDDQDSSEDDEDDDSPQRGGRPGQRANAPSAKKPTFNSAKSSKIMPKPPSEEEKKAAADKKEAARKAAFEKKAAQRERFAEERRNRGKEPVREPDEQKGR